MSWDDDDDNETVTIDYDRVKAVTAMAALLDLGDGDDGVWLPFSQVPELDGVERDDGPGTCEVPLWLAEEKGLA